SDRPSMREPSAFILPTKNSLPQDGRCDNASFVQMFTTASMARTDEGSAMSDRACSPGTGAGALESQGEPRVRREAVQRLVGQVRLQDLAHAEERVEVDARAQAHRLEHEDEVFRDHVAARTRRERATAQAAERAVER